MGGGHRENPGVAFSDCLLRIVGILVLDDRANAMLFVANDTTVAGGVIKRDGQQAELTGIDPIEQTLKGFHLDQRHIAVQNQYRFGRQRRQCLSNRVASAQLLVLHHEIQVVGCKLFTHSIRAVANHHMYADWGQLTRAVDNMAEHGIACHWM
ncbi:Anti-anti-sigma regulatory factor [Pseudomonas syringae pv. actinidiae]|uniref:Anti-anti-sigma regulatory factor n=1 Tax=Pseudomonas syringae pv. actinidiae TaxID=103796 RepID=A0A2V0QXS7_PSESF|nr:Anti-anti-sigma regulatory factor [Pseudomonas syringae pv. actinidiae]